MVIKVRNDMYLHYSFLGLENTTDTPIICLIHGASGNLNHFKDISAILVNKGFRVLVCDARYHGLSQPIRHSTDFQFKDVLEDLDWIISDIGSTYYTDRRMPLFVGGISMGGVLSLLYAARHKNEHWLREKNIEFKGIISIAALVPSLLSPRTEWKVYMKPVPSPEVVELTKKNIIESATFESSRREIRRAMNLVSDVVIYKCLANVAGSMLAEKGQDIPPTHLPTLLIIPEKDEYTKRDMERLHEINLKHNVKSQAAIVKDASHMVILDYSSQVASHIASFCNSC